MNNTVTFEPIMITTHARGGERWQTVKEWPPYTEIALEVIANADPSFLKVDGGRIGIMAYNGMATYKIGRYDVGRAVFQCEYSIGNLTPESEFTFPDEEMPA